MFSNEISRDESNLKGCDLAGRLLGDYCVERRIGAGAMAEVWLARQHVLDRPVALKILRPDLALDETYVRRFVHEAKSAAKLDHPNIVHIYDVGSFSEVASGHHGFLRSMVQILGKPFRRIWGLKKTPSLYYISEEYVEGLNLQQYLRQRGPLSISQTFFVMLSIASALEKAASMEIVHRDIKPENILLGSAGIVKIADFGLARWDSSPGKEDVTLTQIGMTLGTPLYMSPEQSQGKDIDFRSDIYSFGVTTWQILTGKTPYTGQTPLSVVLEHLHAPVPSVRACRDDVPLALDAIITRMLAKEPKDRFSSFQELSAAIARAQEDYLSGIDFADQGDARTLVQSEDELAKVAATLSESGHESFKEAMLTSAVSLRLQTRFQDLRAVRSGQGNIFARSWCLTCLVLFLICMGLGGLGAFWFARSAPVFMSPPSAVNIERFDSIEEQWVFASQLNTADAWKSVIDYAPDQEYWCRKARQQLARTYVLDSAVSRAKPLFVDFAEMPASEPQYVAFGQAGLAWCMASEGNTSGASAMLSELRTVRNIALSPLTEDLISRTQNLIRNRKQ